MEASIEQRLGTLEKRLGLPEFDGSLESDAVMDIAAMKREIVDLGYGFIFKIGSQLWENLREVTEDPKYATFDGKREAIECEYDLMMERINLLEQFHKSSEVVLNSEQLKNTNELQPSLDSAKQEMMSAAEDVNKYLDEITNLKNDFCDLVSEMELQLKEFDELITKAEKNKGVS
uniref:Dynactin subunit 2 n=1 Tax=Syphacia muris TaxID=451379 RepID=A0A0N5AQ19_9BILA